MAEENEEVRVNGMTIREFAERCRRANPITVYVYDCDLVHSRIRVIDPARISEFYSDEKCTRHLHAAPNPYCYAYQKIYSLAKREEIHEQADINPDGTAGDPEDEKGAYMIKRYLIFAIPSVPIEEEGKAE